VSKRWPKIVTRVPSLRGKDIVVTVLTPRFDASTNDHAGHELRCLIEVRGHDWIVARWECRSFDGGPWHPKPDTQDDLRMQQALEAHDAHSAADPMATRPCPCAMCVEFYADPHDDLDDSYPERKAQTMPEINP
jgi:hypothetical protein